MKLTEHFDLEEFVKKGYNPDNMTIGHLRLLCSLILEPLRVEWGSGITVTSGWRPSEVNDNTPGASKTSAHPLGFAADIVPANGKIKEFKAFVKQWLKENAILFDQCIDERNARGSEWVHLGLMNGKGEMRHKFLKTTDGIRYYQDVA